MRVLFGNTQYGYLSYGGAEVQLERTRDSLRQLGVDVALYSQWNKTILNGIDILHWFHIDSTSIPIFQHARRKGIYIIITAIFWPLRPCIDPFWTRITGLPKRLGIPITSALSQARETLHLADVIIASSYTEANCISRVFSIPKKRIKVVPLGISNTWSITQASNLFEKKYGLKDFVLNVGRIEPRKNQLRLLKALKDVDIPIVIIGDQTLNPEYYQACIGVKNPRALFLGHIEHEDPLLHSAYETAAVFAMPSMLETPGLVALEAALAGCRLAITYKGNTRDYFKNYPVYINPSSISDIKNGVLEAKKIDPKRISELKDLILREYTWESVGRKIKQIYTDLILQRYKG